MAQKVEPGRVIPLPLRSESNSGNCGQCTMGCMIKERKKNAVADTEEAEMMATDARPGNGAARARRRVRVGKVLTSFYMESCLPGMIWFIM